MNKQTIKDRIMALYYQDERIASDDALLIAMYWQPDWDNTKSLEYNISHLTRPETITRRRRELINEGKIKATKLAESERYEAFINEQAEHSDQAGFIDYIENKRGEK
jgi:hypothetical protein